MAKKREKAKIVLQYSEPDYVRAVVDGVRTEEFNVSEHDSLLAGILAILDIDAEIKTEFR